MLWTLVWEWPWLTAFFLYITVEVWHHFWSLSKVREIDHLYARAALTRDVDIVDHPPWEQFSSYWQQSSPDFVKSMRMWSSAVGADLDEIIIRAKDKHISEDFASEVDPGQCVFMPLWFRTFNTLRLWLTGRALLKQGFRQLFLNNVHLYYYSKQSSVKIPLLVVFPQFSGEFNKLSVFAELKNQFDVLFVGPLGTQCSWWHKPSRHVDALGDYLPVVLKYDKISIVTWSAGNIHFQVLDRYLELRGLRHMIQTVVRMDPLGYPASNFLIFSGLTLSLKQLHNKFLNLCTEHTPSNQPVKWRNYLGSLGFAYLLKSCHGFTYMKLGRMLRVTKLACAPYPEHHFTASFDPCWSLDHPVFANDKELLCANVTEHHVQGFHGLWLTQDLLRSRVFPILKQNHLQRHTELST
jgi:hypothetical protein